MVRMKVVIYYTIVVKKYPEEKQTVKIGEKYQYTFKTPLEEVYRVRVKIPNTNKRCYESLYRPLPGGVHMPTWMEYDPDQNMLRSKDILPEYITWKELIIQIKDKDNMTREQFTLYIQNEMDFRSPTATDTNEMNSPFSAQDVSNGVELKFIKEEQSQSEATKFQFGVPTYPNSRNRNQISPYSRDILSKLKEEI